MYKFICISKMETAASNDVACTAVFLADNYEELSKDATPGAFTMPVTYPQFQQLEVGRKYTLTFNPAES